MELLLRRTSLFKIWGLLIKITYYDLKIKVADKLLDLLIKTHPSKWRVFKKCADK